LRTKDDRKLLRAAFLAKHWEVEQLGSCEGARRVHGESPGGKRRGALTSVRETPEYAEDHERRKNKIGPEIVFPTNKNVIHQSTWGKRRRTPG